MRALGLVLPVFAALGLLLAGCEEGSDRDEVAEILDRAFARPIGSANVDLDSTIRVRGVPQLDRPIRVRAGGPYKSAKGKPPEFDIDLKVGVEGGGASIDTGRVSVGDRAFVKFQGSFYELPRDQVVEANEAFEGHRAKGSRLSELGVNPRSWIRSAKDEGDEEVAGVKTRHISGQLDVRRVMADLNRLVARAGKTLGAGAAVPRPLPTPVLDKISQVVRNPSFDVYVGADGGRIRRLSTNVQLDVPQADREHVRGIEGGALELTLELRDVGGEQRIMPPAQSRPLSDLTKQLGGAGVLSLGGFGGTGRQGGQGPQPPQRQSPPRPQEGGGGDAETFQRYADCLEHAGPQNTAAQQRCSQLLQP
ncbi:MAG: hypothetical protein M3433_01355 [Actinomycetota bacterium]|nr:hypothetical protein [Actinomycetota bacterium]